MYYTQDRMIRLLSRLLALSGLALAASLVGCSDNQWQAATHPTAGSLTINGQVAAGAVVELRPAGDAPDIRNSRPWAVVDEQGDFRLTTYETDDGAPAGDYKLTVKWPPTVNKPSLADRLNGAFDSPEESKWPITIAAGENDLGKIEITGVRISKTSQANRRVPPGPGMGPMGPSGAPDKRL